MLGTPAAADSLHASLCHVESATMFIILSGFGQLQRGGHCGALADVPASTVMSHVHTAAVPSGDLYENQFH